jgi:thiol peroxidase
MREVRFDSRPFVLGGTEKKAGDKAPSFHVINRRMEDVSSDEFSGKIVVISVFPSVDTPVCSRQNKRFNKEAAALGDDVAILSISADLPFAQARFCDVEGIRNAFVYSDYQDLDFGTKYGFVIDPLRLLSRGVVVIDRKGVIRYIEYTADAADEVNYEKALETVKSLQ